MDSAVWDKAIPRVSSSSIASVAATTANGFPPSVCTVVVPETESVSRSSSMSSSTGVSVNSAAPLCTFAGMVRVNGVTASKSSVPAASAPVPAPTDTVTAVGEDRCAPSSSPVTVTVTAPPPSSTAAGTTESRTSVEGTSLSVTVTA